MPDHRQRGFRLHDSITGEPQLYLPDIAGFAAVPPPATGAEPASSRLRAFRRLVARCLHLLNVVRRADPTPAGHNRFAP